MWSKSFIRGFLFCFTFTIASQLVYKYYSRKKTQDKRVRKEIHEVIMFSQDGAVAQLRKSRYSRCMITQSMDRFLIHLNSPRETLDICIYVLSNSDLANAVMKLRYRGVKIRIIVDADMAFCSGSYTKKLEKQGIPVRWMKSTNLMHHKFCLIDTSTDNIQVTPIVMSGSLNWTRQAVYGNYENVIVTTQEEVVRQFKEEFERLWVLFKPVVD